MESGGKEEGQQPADDKEWSAKTGLKRRNTPEKDLSDLKKPESPFSSYCIERMAEVKAKHPEMSVADANDTLLAEWNDLPTDRKQQYIEAAEMESARYAKEYAAFAQTNGPPEKKPKVAGLPEDVSVEREEPPSEEAKLNGRGHPGRHPSAIKHDYVPGTNIHIFTDQFLEHSREMETELRKLRTSNTELKEENSLLDGHIKSMRTLTSRLHKEVKEQEDKNSAVQAHVAALREAVVAALSDVTIPGMITCATIRTADECVNVLNTIADAAAAEHADLVAKVTKKLEEPLSRIQNM